MAGADSWIDLDFQDDEETGRVVVDRAEKRSFEEAILQVEWIDDEDGRATVVLQGSRSLVEAFAWLFSALAILCGFLSGGSVAAERSGDMYDMYDMPCLAGRDRPQAEDLFPRQLGQTAPDPVPCLG